MPLNQEEKEPCVKCNFWVIFKAVRGRGIYGCRIGTQPESKDFCRWFQEKDNGKKTIYQTYYD